MSMNIGLDILSIGIFLYEIYPLSLRPKEFNASI